MLHEMATLGTSMALFVTGGILMNITVMNVKITIQENFVEVDKIGNHTNKWADYYSCFATVSDEGAVNKRLRGKR